MNPPEFRVSVVIPVFKAEAFLAKAVNSALSQPETWEVVLVEDGSPDKSLEICEILLSKFPKVKLYRHPNGENRGAGASRNLAINSAAQDYIAFLDADDYFLPHRFEKTKSVFQLHPDTDGVYECLGTAFLNKVAEASYQDKNRSLLTTVTRNDIPPNELFKELIIQKYGYFSLDGLTVKRSVIDGDQLFDESLRIAQDTDFILRLAEKKTLRPGNLDNAVSIRGVHGENRTLITKNVLKSKNQFAAKWFHRIKDHQWPRAVNLRFLIQYSMAAARLKTTGIGRWPIAVINFIKNVIINSWILKKIL